MELALKEWSIEPCSQMEHEAEAENSLASWAQWNEASELTPRETRPEDWKQEMIFQSRVSLSHSNR